MPQVIRCPHCQRSMQVPDNAAGKTVRCPVCQKPFMVPAANPKPNGAGVSSGAAVLSSAVGSKPSITLPPVPSGPASSGSGQACPSCGSILLPGAIACMDCGFLLQTDG